MLIRQQNALPRRVSRSPNFPVVGKIKPYGLYPLWGLPVLPGETLQSANMKWRLLSDPVKNPLAGAWSETWLVYVKLTDIDPDLGNMFISDSVATTGYTAAADNERYFVKAGQIDWMKLCCDKIHNSFFVHENETARSIDGVNQVKLNNVGWYQNMLFQAADEAVPTNDSSDMYEHLSSWAMLQQMNMTELTYEKYLETFGVKPTVGNERDPEILRYSRSWTQPVNTVDPTDGSPSSAWIWSDKLEMSKAKRFDEPGFVVCVTTVRPKMYQAGLTSSMLGNLWGFSDWYPSYNLSDPTAGAKKIMTDDGLFAAATRVDVGEKEMLYDHRDLLTHGEQFINTSSHIHPVPTSNGMKMDDASTPQDIRGEYCLSTDVDNLFVTATADNRFCTYEGIASCVISGHVNDSTPL